MPYYTAIGGGAEGMRLLIDPDRERIDVAIRSPVRLSADIALTEVDPEEIAYIAHTYKLHFISFGADKKIGFLVIEGMSLWRALQGLLRSYEKGNRRRK